jgi:hypothetical protein
VPVPGEEFVDAIGRMVADAADQIGKIDLRIYAVQLAALDQGVEDRGALAAGVQAKEGPVAWSKRQGADPRLRASLVISRRPCSVKRQSASQRLRL